MKTRDSLIPHAFGMRNLHPTTFLSRCLPLASAAVLAGSLFGQGNGGSAPGRLSLPEDWSHQSVVFSPPASPQAAAALQKDPRYQLQLRRRRVPPPPPSPGPHAAVLANTEERTNPVAALEE